MMNPLRIPRNLPGSDIRLIGDRGSGKTTFLAALSHCWRSSEYDGGPIESVDPFNEISAELQKLAINILQDGRSMPPSDSLEENRLPPLLTFYINLKPKLLAHPLSALRGQSLRLQVSCREYEREFFQHLIEERVSQIPALSNYLDDCASVAGLLLLLDGTSTADREYAQALGVLQRELNRRSRSGRNRRSFRIAVVFSKGEQDTVWVYRDNLEEFIGLKFPRTRVALQNWGCSVNYFICSAFGMVGNPPRPNFREISQDRYGVYGAIARTQAWKPFGLVAPIYWLQTGKDDRQLRES